MRSASADARFADLTAAARTLQPRTVALRRAIHAAPELGLHLPDTQAAVLAELADLPLEIHRGGSSTSVVAVLRGARPGPTVLLRGDMDALPLTEDTQLPYASRNPGTMHACGHDGHTAMLAAAARLLCGRVDELAGSVVFMFQPGEEGFHGARHMLAEGLLDVAGEPVGSALALHLGATLPSGLVVCRPETMMAAADILDVRVTGRGGHASAPHEALDPVPAAAAMVGALQTMVTRRVSVFTPAVVTVTRISAGTTNNIIPEVAELEGTIRTTTPAARDTVLAELRRICEHVAAAHDCTAEVTVTPCYPMTRNDAATSATVLELANAVLGDGRGAPLADPLMGAEDFSYVLERVPGALAFLGACPPGTDPDTAPPNHSNRVLFDEAALPVGVAVYAAFALDALR